MTENFEAWVGREARVSSHLDPWPVQALRATLGLEPLESAPADALAPLWAWLYFLDTPEREQIGRDGHPALGGFMPPVSAERRMFGGGQSVFLRPLRIGRPAHQVRRIEKIEAKTGGSGPMTLVTVAYDYVQDGELCLKERRDIVYLQSAPASAPTPPAAAQPGSVATAALSLDATPDAVMLARFSALTFNAHRIHYDLPYARDVEGYPERVVHGPLTALMLAEMARLQGGMRLTTFRFRAHAPLFLGDGWRLRGTPDGAGAVSLVAYDGRGARVMTATAETV